MSTSTHNIGNDSISLHAKRLDGLKYVYHSLCLQSLQLGVDANESPCTPNAISEMMGRETEIETETVTVTERAYSKCYLI